MFNVLITFDETAWETDQLMRMDVTRFKEYSDGEEAKSVTLNDPKSIKLLEIIPTLLMYETCTTGPTAETVRYGKLADIRQVGDELVFGFRAEGRFPISVVRRYAGRLGLGKWEQSRTHWAIKQGNIPKGMLNELQPFYDLVFSFAGEERPYVEQVAKCLNSHGVTVFYDGFEEANLWGKDLAEHLDFIYRRSSEYCVVFISKNYVEKMWPRHERRSAFARALGERKEYILPARFDATEVLGLPSTVGHVSLDDRAPAELAQLILKKLGRQA